MGIAQSFEALHARMRTKKAETKTIVEMPANRFKCQGIDPETNKPCKTVIDMTRVDEWECCGIVYRKPKIFQSGRG